MIYLPKDAPSHPTRSIHNGRHTTSNSQQIAEQMQRIVNQGKMAGWSDSQYRAATIQLLSDLRQELRKGNIALNSIHRPWSQK